MKHDKCSPFKAITLDTGFMMAASALIFCRVTVLPLAISTIAIWPKPDSQTVMNLSDSIEHEPNFTFSNAIDSGGCESC